MTPFDPSSASAEFIDQLYAQFQAEPSTLGPDWQAFFRGFEFATRQLDGSPPAAGPGDGAPPDQNKGVHGLVQAYRQLGHYVADLDPLGQVRPNQPLLALAEFGLGEEDLDRLVGRGGFVGGTDNTLRDLLQKLRTTYCGPLGVEYLSIADKEQRDWLQARVESTLNRTECTDAYARRILLRLIEAEEFEQFLHTRYVGQKRFSIEGAESLLPLLDALVTTGADLGMEELVLGMAHRGRLNVLAHLLRKPYEVILSEFEGVALSERLDTEGDVKYHMGYSHDLVTDSGRRVHLSLSSNPSHLELVNPVVEGTVHTKQNYLFDRERTRVVPLLIHGEAAFTGQGIVTEVLHLCQLEGYQTGGTIHVIINNQLGYTALPAQTRFTPYPTDVARQMQAPVFHVNADDPEAAVQAARLAIDFRQRFGRDVFIDLWCYRRHGHNEADDPTLTQPLMYRTIQGHPTVVQRYTQHLLSLHPISAEEVEELRARVRARLEDGQAIARRLQVRPSAPIFGGVWQGMTWATDDWSARTAVDGRSWKRVADALTRVPEGFSLHRTLQRMVKARRAMLDGQQPLDWGCGEAVAFGSLLLEGIPVRLAGQDSQRGTFAHRHAVWHDTETGEEYVPLAHIAPDQGRFSVYNTMLSEAAVLGFEYGVATADPRVLTLWEAQFGDFVNGAQPVLDQFVTSGEAKWQRMCGLALLLPHGYEGMGPEHSSARLERFLEQCAKRNMQVVYPTTPAQLFHVLRRQMHRNFRKPLVVMTPKSMLRHKRCVAPVRDFTEGGFQTVIADPVAAPEEVERVLLCTGKVYYDLLEALEARPPLQARTAIVRVEQLYPFPESEVRGVLDRYAQARYHVWVQEEAQNMGAWSFVRWRLQDLLPPGSSLGYAGRDEAASPATGSYEAHQREQREVVAAALGVEDAGGAASWGPTKAAAASH